ncbi:hypothetical protein, partial [Microcoleus sp. herbarium12]|uniref:hypothetical protein n=1 Tax=Microcoleus sp. herbarium12 TaxID=3055437 RepID=UPI002FD6BCB2
LWGVVNKTGFYFIILGVGLMGGEKPGFCEDIRCEAKISEKTRFLRWWVVARNRVFAKIFDGSRRYRKKPGF